MMTPCFTVEIELDGGKKGLDQAYRQHFLICQPRMRNPSSK